MTSCWNQFLQDPSYIYNCWSTLEPKPKTFSAADRAFGDHGFPRHGERGQEIPNRALVFNIISFLAVFSFASHSEQTKTGQATKHSWQLAAVVPHPFFVTVKSSKDIFEMDAWKNLTARCGNTQHLPNSVPDLRNWLRECIYATYSWGISPKGWERAPTVVLSLSLVFDYGLKLFMPLSFLRER